MRLTLRDVYAALDYGSAHGGDGVVFSGVSTDTRSLQPGDLFVALMGPQTDGHQHIAAALRAGAAGLVVSQNVVASPSLPVLRVPDTQVAYGLLARFWRDRFDIPVVGVTGSVGKTTVKEMLVAALSPLGPILKTAASQNNETGVPKALVQLTSAHKAAVVEMGMRGSGQIAYLCSIARPTVGVLTVIADNHWELLGSLDAIADAKGELLEALPKNGVAVLNAADPYWAHLSRKTAARVVMYGQGQPPPPAVPASPSPVPGEGLGKDNKEEHSFLSLPLSREVGEGAAGTAGGGGFSAEDITQTETGWKFMLRGVPVEIHTASRHDIGNALAALTVANALGVPLEAAAEALKTYAPPPMRMNITKTGWGGTVLNDAYNAAPASMATALHTLTAYGGGRKIAFLGDMRELGARAEDAHRELGPLIDSLGGLHALYTVGDLAALIPNAAQRFAGSADAALFVREGLELMVGDVILVKGSRAMAMEKIAGALEEPRPAENLTRLVPRHPLLEKGEGRSLLRGEVSPTLPASGGEAEGRGGVGSA